MHERPPLIRAIDSDVSVAHSLCAKQVDNEIEPSTSGNAVYGSETKASYGEVSAVEGAEHRFGRNLASCIKRLRIKARSFVDDLVACTIDRAGARKDEPANPACFGYFTDYLGRGHVHVHGKVAIDGTRRIAHQPAEMDHRANAVHGSSEGFDMTEVFTNEGKVSVSGHM